jgi:hypothetical protein
VARSGGSGARLPCTVVGVCCVPGRRCGHLTPPVTIDHCLTIFSVFRTVRAARFRCSTRHYTGHTCCWLAPYCHSRPPLHPAPAPPCTGLTARPFPRWDPPPGWSSRHRCYRRRRHRHHPPPDWWARWCRRSAQLWHWRCLPRLAQAPPLLLLLRGGWGCPRPRPSAAVRCGTGAGCVRGPFAPTQCAARRGCWLAAAGWGTRPGPQWAKRAGRRRALGWPGWETGTEGRQPQRRPPRAGFGATAQWKPVPGWGWNRRRGRGRWRRPRCVPVCPQPQPALGAAASGWQGRWTPRPRSYSGTAHSAQSPRHTVTHNSRTTSTQKKSYQRAQTGWQDTGTYTSTRTCQRLVHVQTWPGAHTWSTHPGWPTGHTPTGHGARTGHGRGTRGGGGKRSCPRHVHTAAPHTLPAWGDARNENDGDSSAVLANAVYAVQGGESSGMVASPMRLAYAWGRVGESGRRGVARRAKSSNTWAGPTRTAHHAPTKAAVAGETRGARCSCTRAAHAHTAHTPPPHPAYVADIQPSHTHTHTHTHRVMCLGLGGEERAVPRRPAAEGVLGRHTAVQLCGVRRRARVQGLGAAGGRHCRCRLELLHAPTVRTSPRPLL